MHRLHLLLLSLLVPAGAAWAEAPPPAPVPCRSIDDCWMNASGEAIKRPGRLKGKPLPRGNCGNHIVWLRNELACEQNVCVVRHHGDKC